jgi:hypothetical protein
LVLRRRLRDRGDGWRDLTRDAVRNAPEFDPHGSLAREYETRLHAHYGRAGYWERAAEAWRFLQAA